jgi:hypothetical protein
MLVIRRMETRTQGFTVMMLGRDYCAKFPTTLHEHERILQIFKQDRRHQDVSNDFSEYDLGPPATRAGS